MNAKRQKRLFIAVGISIAIMTFLMSYFQVLYSVDKLVADPLYQDLTVTNKNIKIIAIDEKTLEAYGDLKTWNREIPGKLVELLN